MGKHAGMDAVLASLIEDLADRADDLLAGTRDRAQARAEIVEHLANEHPSLDADARGAVTAGVMAILEEEDFFGIEFVGDPFADNEQAAD